MGVRGPRGRRHHDDGPDTPRAWRLRGFGGPAGPFGGPFGGRGRLARRGDVRIAILAVLGERPMHGYQVIQELEARSGGRWRPSAGSVYPTLQQLEDEGFVRSEEQGGRRVFTLTDEGRQEAARRDMSRAPWGPRRDASGDQAFELRELSLQVVAATMQVGRVGGPEAGRHAREILVDARRRLYRLLAEDERTSGEAETTYDTPMGDAPGPEPAD
jgi:DNA-binding PadR family transcriptional regulator